MVGHGVEDLLHVPTLTELLDCDYAPPGWEFTGTPESAAERPGLRRYDLGWSKVATWLNGPTAETRWEQRELSGCLLRAQTASEKVGQLLVDLFDQRLDADVVPLRIVVDGVHGHGNHRGGTHAVDRAGLAQGLSQERR